jgi:hypothetical protein
MCYMLTNYCVESGAQDGREYARRPESPRRPRVFRPDALGDAAKMQLELFLRVSRASTPRICGRRSRGGAGGVTAASSTARRAAPAELAQCTWYKSPAERCTLQPVCSQRAPQLWTSASARPVTSDHHIPLPLPQPTHHER